MIISTPEHVQVPFDTAGIGTRMLAKVVDFLCIGLVWLPVVILVSTFSTLISLTTYFELPSVVVGVAWIILAFVPILYFVVNEYFFHGQTLGKRLFRLRVIADDGKQAGFSAVFLRNILQFIDFLPAGFLLGMIAIFLHPKEKRIGDLAAGTLVIQERIGKVEEIVFQYISTALSERDQREFSRLPLISSELYGIVESFLARRSQLHTTSRNELAQQMITIGWPQIEVVQGKEELFLEKVYLYLRDNHYVANYPRLVPAYFAESAEKM